MKMCAGCGVAKAESQFGTDRSRGDGLNVRCLACKRLVSAAYRGANVEKIRRQDARPRHRGAGPGQKAWAQRNADRVRVMARAGEALRRAERRGQVIRPDRCVACGQVGLVEAAHSDYAQPLLVRWLCRKCHRGWDRAQPKTVNLSAGVLARQRPGPKRRNPDADEETDKAYEDEPLKAAVSDGFKRAAVQWGIGRWLYGDT